MNMVHGNYKKIQSAIDPHRKKKIWLQYYYGAWNLKHFNSTIHPHRKKSRFWIQYNYCAWDLEEIQSAHYPRRKINILVFCLQSHCESETEAHVFDSFLFLLHFSRVSPRSLFFPHVLNKSFSFLFNSVRHFFFERK